MEQLVNEKGTQETTIVRAMLQKASEVVPSILSTSFTQDGQIGYFPVGIFQFIHAFAVCYAVRRKLSTTASTRMPLFQEAFVCLIYSMGGSMISALFLGLPQPWLESNTALLVNTIAYFIVNQSPGDIVYNFLESVAPIGDLIMFTLDGLQKGYNITNGGVDLVRLKMKGQAVSNSLPGMAIIAMLSGSGGGVIADFFNLTSNTWQFRTPTILTQNSSPSPSPLPPVGASRFTKFQLPLNYDMKISLFAGLTYILSARLWTFSEHAPNFALSGIIDAFIDQILPRLTEKEARLVVGTMVATLNGYGSYIQHCNFMRIKNSSKSNQPSEKNQNVKKPESKKSK